ncbi:hypothetical protein [Membranihabitans maritimus]|uniref:hypothetical protein n=1 Tax=Membranihabitans maritimus TaxID=2904244 RepID=UPI001F274CD8|nr:hypothetical protein [Membranihabitans maritimus]
MRILMLSFFFLLAIGLEAQDKGKNRFEEIHAQKVAFITEKINLSVDEAQDFWPVYNEYRDKIWDLKKSQDRIRESDLTDENARAYLMKELEIDEKKLALTTEFYNNISKVISYKRVYLLEKAEDEFRHKLLERFRKGKEKN